MPIVNINILPDTSSCTGLSTSTHAFTFTKPNTLNIWPYHYFTFCSVIVPRAPLTWQQPVRQCQAEIITLLIMPIHHPPVTSEWRDEQGSPKNTFCLSFPLRPSWPRPEVLSVLNFDTQVFTQVFPWLEGLLSQAAY